jgi:hypothetical protein
MAIRVRDDGVWLSVALLDLDEDAQALRESFDIDTA